MNISAIGTDKIFKPAKRIATLALGAGLFLSSCSSSKYVSTDSFQKENTEFLSSNSTEDKHIIGELLLGTGILGGIAMSLRGKNRADKK